MELNFFGAVACVREVLPLMLRRDSGLIVNVATIAALHGVPHLGAYGASKAALVALSQSLRAELAGTGVGVMIVYPGYTDTEIFDVERKVGGARRPPGPYAPAEEVAEAIARGIEAGRRDLFPTARGRLLSFLSGAAPFVVERAMRRIARELRDAADEPGPPGGRRPSRRTDHEQAHARDHRSVPEPRRPGDVLRPLPRAPSLRVAPRRPDPAHRRSEAPPRDGAADRLRHEADFIALSFMDFCAPHAYEVAARFRAKGKKVIAGGRYPSTFPEEVMPHFDCVVAGEAERVWPGVVEDLVAGRLKKRYDAPFAPPLDGIPRPATTWRSASSTRPWSRKRRAAVRMAAASASSRSGAPPSAGAPSGT